MKAYCVWEHNGNDTLLYAVDYIGAYTRGESLEIAKAKMPQEIIAYLKWLGDDTFDNLKAHTFSNGINAINVFVKKPLIPLPPDVEKSELAAGNWKLGEIFMYYHDWLFRKNEEKIFDCNSSGIPHKHCMDVIIAEKI